MLARPTLDRYAAQIRQGQQRGVLRPPEGLQKRLRLGLVRDLRRAYGKGRLLRLLRRRGLRGGEAQLLHQLAELQAQKHMVQLRLYRPAQVRLRVEVQGRVGDDGGQMEAQPGALLPLGQLLDGGRASTSGMAA